MGIGPKKGRWENWTGSSWSERKVQRQTKSTLPWFEWVDVGIWGGGAVGGKRCCGGAWAAGWGLWFDENSALGSPLAGKNVNVSLPVKQKKEKMCAGWRAWVGLVIEN